MAVQIVYSAVLSIFRKCHQNLTFFALENIYIVNCHNENMTKPFDYLVHKQWCQDFSSWWHWHFHWHEYLLLRNELSILSKWHAFAGYQLGFAVCTNCFEKCINCCATVNSDVRNAPKRLRKTVMFFLLLFNYHAKSMHFKMFRFPGHFSVLYCEICSNYI